MTGVGIVKMCLEFIHCLLLELPILF